MKREDRVRRGGEIYAVLAMGFDGVDGVDFQRQNLYLDLHSRIILLRLLLSSLHRLLRRIFFSLLFFPSPRLDPRILRFANTKIKFSSASRRVTFSQGIWQTWSTMEEEEEIGLLYISRSISASVPYLGSSNRIHIYARPSSVHRDSVNKLYISNGPETDLLASRTSKGSVLPAPCARP